MLRAQSCEVGLIAIFVEPFEHGCVLLTHLLFESVERNVSDLYVAPHDVGEPDGHRSHCEFVVGEFDCLTDVLVRDLEDLGNDRADGVDVNQLGGTRGSSPIARRPSTMSSRMPSKFCMKKTGRTTVAGRSRNASMHSISYFESSGECRCRARPRRQN